MATVSHIGSDKPASGRLELPFQGSRFPVVGHLMAPPQTISFTGTYAICPHPRCAPPPCLHDVGFETDCSTNFRSHGMLTRKNPTFATIAAGVPSQDLARSFLPGPDEASSDFLGHRTR